MKLGIFSLSLSWNLHWENAFRGNITVIAIRALIHGFLLMKLLFCGVGELGSSAFPFNRNKELNEGNGRDPSKL